MSLSPLDFILSQTSFGPVAFVPEISLFQATEITPLWTATESWMQKTGTPPPFWAFVWAGGQGMARYILDHPEEVRGKRVLDFAAGSGIAAIAAAKAGASHVIALDIDPLSETATQLNASRNGVTVERGPALDMTRAFTEADVILAGDVCYEQAMSALTLNWLYLCVAAGKHVLMGDPHRAYKPEKGLQRLAHYDNVPVPRELEDRDTRSVTIWQVLLPEA